MKLCIAYRQKIIEDVDGSSSKIDLSRLESDDEDVDAVVNRKGPSAEALAKINDYCEYLPTSIVILSHALAQ